MTIFKSYRKTYFFMKQRFTANGNKTEQLFTDHTSEIKLLQVINT